MKNQIMKNILFLLTTLIIISCGSPQSTTKELPTDLEGLRTLLSEKKTEMRTLTNEIKELNAKVDKLAPPSKKKKTNVKSAIVATSTFQSKAKIQGAVMSDKFASATSETGGRITSLLVDEGDFVSQGQLIATVDLSTIENQKTEIQTSLSLAKNVFERQERLWKQNIGSELQYLEAKNTVERLEKSLTTIQSTIAKKNVTAPITGVIDRKILSQGELAGPGVPIVQILNTNSLKIVADVPETYLTSTKRGQSVDIYFPALDKKITKKISMVGRSIDPSNRTYKVEINTSSLGNSLKPNLLAEVEFVEQTLKNVIVISPSIIKDEVSGKKYVFTNNDGKARKNYIETGESNDENIVILSGLEAGQEVITEGGFLLTDGDLINIDKSEEE